MKKLYLLNLCEENQSIFNLVSKSISLSKKVIYIVPNKVAMDNKKLEYIYKLGGISNLNFCTFDDFKKTDDNKILIDDILRAQIIKRLLKKNNYGVLKYSEGLVEVMLDFINKSRENLIEWNFFKDSKNEILKCVSDLFFDYENYLNKNNLVDFLKVGDINSTKADLIVVDGFYSLKEIEYEILENLANRINTLVNIPYFLDDIQVANKMANRILDMEFEKIDFRAKKSSEEFLRDIENSKRLFLIKNKGEDEKIIEIFKNIKGSLIEGRNVNDFFIVPFSNSVKNLEKISRLENIPLNKSYSERNKSKVLSEFKDVLKYFKVQNRENILKRIKSNYFKITDKIDEMEYEISKLNFKNLEELRDITSTSIEISSTNLRDFLELVEKLSNKINFNLEYSQYAEIFRTYLEEAESVVLKNYEDLENESLLKRDISAIESIRKILDNISNYKSFLKEEGFLGFYNLVMDYLDTVNYKESNEFAPKVIKPSQSLGIKLDRSFLCGLNFQYPVNETKNFLFLNMSDEELEKYNVKSQNVIYEEGLLTLLNLIGNSKESYIVDELEDRSIYMELFKDLNYIEENRKSSKLELSLELLENVNSDKFENLKEFGMEYESLEEKTKNTLANEEILLEGSALAKVQNYIEIKGMGVSDFDKYAKCPYSFLYFKIAEIESMEREYDDKFYLEMGNFYHKVLEKYFSKFPKELNEEFLSELIRVELFENLPLNFELSGFEKVKYDNVLAILKEFIIMDLENRNGFEPIEFEVPFKLMMDNLKIVGRIDRVDSNGKYKLLIDYKSNKTPTLSNIKNGKSFQLPLYIMSQKKDEIAGARYASINENKYNNVLINKDLIDLKGAIESDKYFKLLENVRDNINFIRGSIEKGEFLRVECNGCEYRDLCRQVIL